MKTLLLHPEDSPRRGPWTAERWELVVDLGRSSPSTAKAWEDELGCPVVRLESFRRNIEDPRTAGQILRRGLGRLVDREGIDWWELTSLLIHAELETAVALRRMVPTLSSQAEFFTTRRGWPADALARLLGRKIAAFPRTDRRTLAGRLGHYQGVLHRFSLAQLTEIFWDKYDADFRMRARLSSKPQRGSGPFVLVPSAYTNVARMAAAYAALVPELRFLLVYTRGSGKQFVWAENVSVVGLSAYAGGSPPLSECTALQQKWGVLRADLKAVPEIELLSSLGILNQFTKWFSDGLAIRDAWIEVFRRESIQAVFCGDDSNWHTRLPVVLGRKRGLPTIDFHHGALDGRFLLKNLPSDMYLAKSEMEFDYLTRICAISKERIVIGAPNTPEHSVASRGDRREGSSIVFFSEPYESVGCRADEVYRELLPPLATLAATCRKGLVIKLHPFESAPDRKVLVQQVLPAKLTDLVDVRSGPLEERLLDETWFGITVESTTVIDCAQRGIPCFIAGWMVGSPYGYAQQYSAYGVGQTLMSADQLSDIPALLVEKSPARSRTEGLWQAIEPGKLRWLLSGGYRTDHAKSQPLRVTEP